MTTATIIYIFIAAIAAVGLSYSFYFFGKKRNTSYPWIFFFLRFITLFSVFLLLINPKFEKEDFYTEKPELLLAVDNSASIAHFEESENVIEFVDAVRENQNIQEQFNVNTFSFGTQLNNNSNFNFSEPQTNIFNSISSLEKLYRGKTAAVVLITDGNQTFGQDYRFLQAKNNQPIIPVVVGDTTSYIDIGITQLNANRYAFLDNQFPVEVILNYNINKSEQTRFTIKSGNTILYSESLTLSPRKNSHIITTHLPANSIGAKTYTASVEVLPNEKNTINNTKKFAVEVIDERTKILILTDLSHPDLGAMKRAAETNQQRSVSIKSVTETDLKLEDYQVLILYQPNQNFQSVFEEIQRENYHYFMVTGLQTNWSFVNRVQSNFQKEITNATENYLPVLNSNYSSFQIENDLFPDYPPLEDSFGEINTPTSSNVLLYQKIDGIETENPLLITFEKNQVKMGALFGENIWKWRSQSFIETGSFQDFDDFFGKLIQYLSKNQKKERLTVNYEQFYHANDEILVTSQVFDENYEFDARQQLHFKFKKEGDEEQSIPFILQNNKYQVNLSSLDAGIYQFTVQVDGKTLSKSGSFEILEYGVEQQFLNPDVKQLQQLANRHNEDLFFISEKETFINFLVQDKRFTPVQKSNRTIVPVIDWYYLLILIVLALSAEWFLRKYNGLI